MWTRHYEPADGDHDGPLTPRSTQPHSPASDPRRDSASQGAAGARPVVVTAVVSSRPQDGVDPGLAHVDLPTRVAPMPHPVVSVLSENWTLMRPISDDDLEELTEIIGRLMSDGK